MFSERQTSAVMGVGTAAWLCAGKDLIHEGWLATSLLPGRAL
jgi:hypothetical protein